MNFIYKLLLSIFMKASRDEKGGYPIFWISYNPDIDAPNMFIGCVNPEISDDEVLNDLLKQVADRVMVHKVKIEAAANMKREV